LRHPGSRGGAPLSDPDASVGSQRVGENACLGSHCPFCSIGPRYSAPAVLSNIVYNYAATPDGQRFFLREPVEGGNAGVFVEPLYVVPNWTALVQ